MLQKGKRAKSESIVANSNFYFPKNSKKTDWEVELGVVIVQLRNFIQKE